MTMSLLQVDNLRVKVDTGIVLDGFKMKVDKGEIAALMGANGSGKSSLAMTLMGNKEYRISKRKW